MESVSNDEYVPNLPDYTATQQWTSKPSKRITARQRESNRKSAQQSRYKKRKVLETLQAEVCDRDERLEELIAERDDLVKENRGLKVKLESVERSHVMLEQCIKQCSDAIYVFP